MSSQFLTKNLAALEMISRVWYAVNNRSFLIFKPIAEEQRRKVAAAVQDTIHKHALRFKMVKDQIMTADEKAKNIKKEDN